MRPLAIMMCLTLSLASELAVAQTDQPKGNALRESSGRTPPEDKGQAQPQGWTGPIGTSSGGAPPESPQGQSPPGMQAAPEGSTKTVVQPDK